MQYIDNKASIMNLTIFDAETQRYPSVFRQTSVINPSTGFIYRFYPTGELYMVASIFDGELNGCLNTYHTNGKIMELVHMEDGLPWGTFQSYYPNGQLKSEGDFRYQRFNGSSKPTVFLRDKYWEFDDVGFVTCHLEFDIQGNLVKNYLAV